MLFLRWLVAIAFVAVVISYATSSRQPEPDTHYEMIPLVHGGVSSGMPLTGIMVDPERGDVYAVVGKAPAQPSSGFFIGWNEAGGRNYATTFPRGRQADATFEISSSHDIHPLHVFRTSSDSAEDTNALTDSQNLLRSVFNALPPQNASAQQP